MLRSWSTWEGEAVAMLEGNAIESNHKEDAYEIKYKWKFDYNLDDKSLTSTSA